MNAHEYLMQAAALDALINSDIKEVERLRQLADALPSLDLCREKVKGGNETQSRMAEIVNRYVDLERKIIAEIGAYVDLKEEIRKTIRAVGDLRLRTVLQCRYLLFYSVEDTAERMNYSVTQVKRLTRAALNAIKIPK